MNSKLILEGMKKAIKKMIEQKAALNEEIVLIDENGKPYRVKAKDLLNKS